jgi:hypothetical protein
MSSVTEFVVYDLLFWSFVAVLLLVAKADHFTHRPDRG